MGRLTPLILSLFLLPAFFLAQAQANETSKMLAGKGYQALVQKNFTKAKLFCQQAMVADPKDVAGFACLGRSLAKTKQGKKADRYYALALARAPNDENALNWAGLRDLSIGRPDKARKKLELLEKSCGQCQSARNLRSAYSAYKENKKKYKAKKNATP